MAATVVAPAGRRSRPDMRGRIAAPNSMGRAGTLVVPERRPLGRPRISVLSGDDAAVTEGMVPARAAPASAPGPGIARIRPTIGAMLPVLLEPAPPEPDTAAVLGAVLVVALVFAIVIVLSLVGL